MMTILAYVDPGLGLLAWQAVVAAFLGLLFYVRKTRSWLLGLVRGLFQANKPEVPEPLPTLVQRPSDEARK